LGNDDGTSLVSTQYNDTIWKSINRLSCTNALEVSTLNAIQFYPNPAMIQPITVEGIREKDEIIVHSIDGQVITTELANGQLAFPNVVSGTYLVTINRTGQQKTFRLLVN